MVMPLVLEPSPNVFRGENAGDVFPEAEGGLIASGDSNMVNCISQLNKLQGQIAALVGKGFTQAGNAERLAGRAAAEHVRGFDFTRQNAPRNQCHVTKIRHIGVMMGEHSSRERLNFREPSSRPAKRFKGD